MLQTSECVCTNCNCVPFVSIGCKAVGEPRKVTVSCKCKSASVDTDTNDSKRSEVKKTFIKYMATPCGVTR